MNDIVRGYAAAASDPAFVARYEAVDSEQLFAPVRDLIPPTPVEVADIGAGTGRDAAWLARKGHRVLAVEPVAALRDAGQKIHADAGIRWLADTLPHLRLVPASASFALICAIGVWQHVAPADRGPGFATLQRLLAPGARAILSLRHGPGAPTRETFAIHPDHEVALAGAAGLRLVRRVEAPSLQAANRAAGVTWTWLALEKS